MSHHPSCRQSDKSLVWLCAQCGEVEPADEIEEQRDELLRALKDLRDNVRDDSPAMWERVDAAIAKAEESVKK